MKKIIVCLAFLLIFPALLVSAQETCKTKPIEKLADKIADAFKSKQLSSLDVERPYLKKFMFKIENSLADDGAPEQFVTKSFRNFRMADKWLKGREFDGFPNRLIAPLIICKKGVCTYDVDGLLHNSLYLKSISFGYKKDKCPYIKSVFLIDGN